MNRVRLTIACATMAVASGACVVVFGMDPLSEKQAVDDAGTPEADAPDASEAEGGVCGPDQIGVIGRPDASAASSDAGTAHFAFTLLDLGIDRGAERPGLDLDRRTTVDNETSSCIFADGGTNALKYGPDTPGGVDNVAFGFLQDLREIFAAFDPERINARLAGDLYGVVLRLDGWNGESDDDEVSLSVFPTIGFWRPDADGGLVARGERVGPFNPDAGHLWTPDERFRLGTIGSLIRSDAAWINGGRLVARFARLTLPLRSSVDELRAFDIEMRDAWVTARVAPDAGTITEGVIGGRVPSGAFLEQVRLMYDDTLNLYGCALVGANRGLLCSSRDVRLSHCDDGKALPCDALSFGARFEARRVDKLGPFRARTDDEYRDAGQIPPSERCADAGATPIDCP